MIDEAEMDAAREELRAATATLAMFHGSWLRLPGIDPALADRIVLEFLLDDCVKTKDHEGSPAWMLDDAVRRDTLRRLGPDGARARWQRAEQRPAGPMQSAIDRILGGEIGSPDARDALELRAELQAGRWFEGVLDRLPDERRTRRRLGVLEVLQPLRGLLSFGFVGREHERARVRRHIDSDGERILVISGVGGVGKSTLLARAVMDELDSAEGTVVAYLNFDRGTLRPDHPADLLAEILSQVALQAPAIEVEAAPIIGMLRNQDEADLTWYGLSSRRLQPNVHQSSNPFTQASSGPAGAYGRTNPYVADRTSTSYSWLQESALDLLDTSAARRIILVLDTFEEAQRNEEAGLEVLWRLVRQIREQVPALRTIVSGRALDGQDFDDRFAVRTLGELDRSAAVALIRSQTDVQVDERRANLILERFGRSPLTLRLVVDLIRRDENDEWLGLADSSVDPADDRVLDAVQAGLVQGQLYSRILWHIGDPAVRNLAHPGLVVRKITPEVIRHVLAGPCRLDLDGEVDEFRLFRALEAEATLVERDGDALRHRADVRARMLPWLLLDRPDQARDIHDAAIAHYRADETVEGRAEELYHLLMAERPTSQLDERWIDEAYRLLKPSRDELPRQGQAYLASRSQGDLRSGHDDDAALDDGVWARTTTSAVRSMVQAGEHEAALELLRSRRGEHHESLLPFLEIEVLEDLRRFDEALDLIAKARNVGLGRADDDELELQLRFAEARILERMGRYPSAADAAQAALSFAEDLGNKVDVLVAEVKVLRTTRRAAINPLSWSALADSATELAESIPFRELEQHPGLIRDLLGEVGTRSRQLFELGVGVIGVETGLSDTVDHELGERGLLGEGTRGWRGGLIGDRYSISGPDDALTQSIVQQWRDEGDRLNS